MMLKKAQALVISLWILVVLTIAVVSISQRISLVLKINHRQADKLKAYCLAKAALNLAAITLDKDTNEVDYLNESWAKNENFEKIKLGDDEKEFAVISYKKKEETGESIVYGLIDEDSKININAANLELLIALLKECQIANPDEVGRAMLIWRGAISDAAKIYEALGYLCKAANFSNIQELLLVKGITQEEFKKLKSLVTVNSNTEGKININTASERILKIAGHSILSGNESAATSLAQKIVAERENRGGYFNPTEGVVVTGLNADESAILDGLKNKIIFKSDNFLIAAKGNVGKMSAGITGIYNRTNKKYIFWHET